MLTLDTLSISDHGGDTQIIRDIHALTPPPPPPRPRIGRRTASSLSTFSVDAAPSESFSALVSTIENSSSDTSSINIDNYSTTAARNYPLSRRVGELEERSLLTSIVPDRQPLGSGPGQQLDSLQRVKREEVESKIGAWQKAKVGKIINRFKREEAVINGREREQIQKANSWMKKVERKLEEKRARAVEKMENEMAQARRKAEERKASAESNRGTKVAKVVEKANLMRAIGKPPPKSTFFSTLLLLNH